MKVVNQSLRRLSIAFFAIMLSAGLASADQVSTPGEYDLEGKLSDGRITKVSLKVRSAHGRAASFERKFVLLGPQGESIGSNTIVWKNYQSEKIGDTYFVLYKTRPGLTAFSSTSIVGVLGGSAGGPDPVKPKAPETPNMIVGEYTFSADGRTVHEKLTNLTKRFPENNWEVIQTSGVRSTESPSTEFLGELSNFEHTINRGFAQVQATMREQGTDPNAEFDLAVRTRKVGGVSAVVNSLGQGAIDETGPQASAQLVESLRDRASAAPFNWIALGSNKPLLETALLIEQQTGPHRSWAGITLISGLEEKDRKPTEVLVLEDANGDYVAIFITGSALSN